MSARAAGAPELFVASPGDWLQRGGTAVGGAAAGDVLEHPHEVAVPAVEATEEGSHGCPHSLQIGVALFSVPARQDQRYVLDRLGEHIRKDVDRIAEENLTLWTPGQKSVVRRRLILLQAEVRREDA
ncbi:MAG: hypothetical protein WDN31_02550 [Hyphomicrobium sp.]